MQSYSVKERSLMKGQYEITLSSKMYVQTHIAKV